MSNVEILKKENHIESRPLWEQVFSEDSSDFLDAYYSGKGAANEISVIRDDKGKICSMIHWNPMELMIGNQKRTVDFLVAVATREDMRRKGLMAILMKAGLEKRKAKGMPFVYLTPANEAYYEPFGFVTVGQSFQCQMKNVHGEGIVETKPNDNADLQAAAVKEADKTMSKPDDKPEKFWEARMLKKEEYDQVAQWANGCLNEQYKLFAVRSEKYFTTLQRELASEGGDIIGFFCEDSLKGVVVYTMEEGLEIREPICSEEDIPRVYGAIKNFFLEKSEEAVIIGCSKKLENTIMCSKTMIRILSLKQCISMITAKDELQQYIFVTDPLISENNGTFLLTLSSRGCSLVTVKVNEQECISYSIEELTKLLFSGVYLNEVV